MEHLLGLMLLKQRRVVQKKELIRFYEIALRSANETIYWMDIITDGYDVDIKSMKEDYKEVKEISNILGAIIVNLKR